MRFYVRNEDLIYLHYCRMTHHVLVDAQPKKDGLEKDLYLHTIEDEIIAQT